MISLYYGEEKLFLQMVASYLKEGVFNHGKEFETFTKERESRDS